jgi:integrase
LAAGVEPSVWLFPEGRSLLDAERAARRFRVSLGRAGLPRFRLYDLRHSFASHLLGAGAPINYVANQLGHSNPATTLRFYAHLPTGDRAWSDKLEALRAADDAPRSGHENAHGPVLHF